MKKMKFLNVCVVLAFILSAAATMTFAKPHFSFLTEDDWVQGLALNIRGMDEQEWSEYQDQFNNSENLEGEPYPETTFLTPELYVYPTDPSEENEDVGLVMAWGNPDLSDGNYASAWIYEYGEDPDLSNSTLTIQVEPPCGITTISIGLRDINLRTRSWTWNVAPAGALPPLPPGTLQCSDPTGATARHTIKINLAMTGVAAANPVANSYSNYNSPPNMPPAFSIKNVQALIFDENANIAAQVPVPPPGQNDPRPWNYWLNLVVTPNPSGGSGAGAWYVKWSQPPVVLDPTEDPPVFNGWDEVSDYNKKPILADDWKCKDKRPVTDIHWWGSFVGWDLRVPPPVAPKAFHIGIWTDVPVSADNPFSHPGFMIWENYCDTWVWNFVGYDKVLGQVLDVNDACFQFTQLLSQDEWFFQDPDAPWDTDGDPISAVFWLSISAIYDAADYPVKYPWGWKTRPHFFNDDAVFITNAENPPIDDLGYVPWPPTIGAKWLEGDEIYGPDGASWDLSFELTTKDPAYEDDPIPGDLTFDGTVNNFDLAVLANNWLTSVSIP